MQERKHNAVEQAESHVQDYIKDEAIKAINKAEDAVKNPKYKTSIRLKEIASEANQHISFMQSPKDDETWRYEYNTDTSNLERCKYVRRGHRWVKSNY